MNCNLPPDPPPVDMPPKTMVGLDLLSSVCSTNYVMNTLTGVVVALLRTHFSDVNGLAFNGSLEYRQVNGVQTPINELQYYIWKLDEKVSPIMIEPAWKYKTINIQQRPALLVKRGRLVPQKFALADGWTMGPSPTGKVRGALQTKNLEGTHTIFCVGGSGAEAELLAAEVFDYFQSFAQILRQELKMLSFDVQSVEEVSHFEEFNDKFVVPVVLAYTANRTWRVDTVAPWLKAVTIGVVE